MLFAQLEMHRFVCGLFGALLSLSLAAKDDAKPPKPFELDCERRSFDLSISAQFLLDELGSINNRLERSEYGPLLNKLSEILAWLEELAAKMNDALLDRTLKNLTHYLAHYPARAAEAETFSARRFAFLRKVIAIDSRRTLKAEILDPMAALIPLTWGALKFSPLVEELRPSWQQSLQSYWLSEGWTQAIQLRGLRLANEHEKEHALRFAGACSNLDEGHREGARRRQLKNSMASRLVFIGPHLVGALKLMHNKSMLALNNFRDKNGRLIIARGAVYRVPEALVLQALETPNELRDVVWPEDADFPVYPLLSLHTARAQNPGDYQREIDELATTLLSQEFPKIFLKP